MRLVFFGGGAFAATVLRRLANAHDIALVITPPPAAAGRKLQKTDAPAAAAAAALSLPLCHTITPAELRAANAAMVIVCDYGRLLPPPLLDAAGDALNIHPSLLPRWRGAAPIERAVLAGDAQTGVSIMRLCAELDAGDVLAQTRMPLPPDMTAATLAATLAEQGAALLLQVLAAPAQHPPRPQDAAQATYAGKITAADRLLDFRRPAEQCRRQVLAFAPAPGAHFFLAGERLRALAATAAPDAGAAAPGTLLAADGRRGIVIACGGGALAISRVQRAGRNAMNAADFLRGTPLDARVGAPLHD